jgi:P4 family phage/plasmid primase-like protien
MTTPSPPAAGPVFAAYAGAYAQAGWSCVLPVPPEAKFPPPVGFTGAEGRDTAPEDIAAFSAAQPGASIALRMPMYPGPSGTLEDGWTVIGIDVDAYAKGEKTKHGDRTLAAKEAEWGPLPATWISSARGPGVSGIRFFVAPATRYGTLVKAAQADGTVTGDVEVIQRHHRYAVVWPSPHAGAGDVYRWYDPSGQVVEQPPKPNELPWLPQGWVQGLSEGASALSAAAAPRAQGEAMLDQLASDFRPECADMTSARLKAIAKMEAAEELTRHDEMTDRTWEITQLAAAGHPGAGPAFMAMREVWAQTTAGESREDEFERGLLTAARKAVTTYGAVQVPNDPCLLFAGGVAYQSPVYGQSSAARQQGWSGSLSTPAPAAGDPGDVGTVEGQELQIVEPPRWVSIRQILGAHAFDPTAGLDQTLAESVLERVYPALRFAYDSGGWLLRVPDRWELHGGLSKWAVAQLANLMPMGDPDGEKGGEALARHQRRTRLMTTAGARAVAGKMDDLVSGGMHPAAVRLADLDSDPEVLWAGGVPWDLRASSLEPQVAALDPSTPHLHTAPMAPAVVPTPYWDTFLEATFPDPGVRTWAIRVLSISLTGYADRALPILLGETGRGKTSLVVLLMSVLGTYGHAANPKLLAAGSNEHDTIVFDLKGRRLSFIDEAPSSAKAAQERLKQITGGGQLTGRKMNQDPITFDPTHTLVLTTNDDPTLTDPAVRSRVRLIPFYGDPEAVRTARKAIGPVSGPVWRAEAPGVLAQLMSEAAGWLADNTTGDTSAAPESIRYLAEHLGAEQDPVIVWVREECEEWPAGTPSRELYQQFTASCRRNNMRADAIPTETKWGRTVTSLGYPSEHSEHGKRRRLRVRPEGFLSPQTPLPTTEATRQPNPSGIPAPGAGGSVTEQIAQIPDGLTPSADGLLTGSQANPSGAFSQVNPPVSLIPDGYDGLTLHTGQTHTPAHTHEPGYGFSLNPSGTTPASTPEVCVSPPPAKPKREPKACAECGGTTGVRGLHDSDCATGAAQAVKNEAAKTKRAEAAEEKRIAAIEAAAGAHVGLPALVTRDGAVRAVTLEQADALLATITGPTGHGELTVDVEHTGYPIGHRNYALRTIQLGDETLALVLDASDQAHAELAREHLTAARELHAHSAGADITPLAVAGLLDPEEAWGRMTDTGTLAKIADPASTGNSDDLKGLAKALLPDPVAHGADQARSELFKAGKWKTDVEVTHPIESSGWAQVDHTRETMIRYDGADVLDCAAIARRLPALAPDQLTRERTAQRMTARVGHTGFRFVPEQIDRLHDEHSATKAAISQLIPVENPGSNDQLGAMLAAMGAPLPATGTGKPSVAKGVLEPLAGARGSDRTWAAEATSEVQAMARLILDWRHSDTALKLFLDPWRDMVRNGDGRARSTVHTLGADTGRMSSVRFNLQQISREGGMRSCISADPGWLLITADFSSVEVRVAAALSQDAALIKMLADGVDLHGEIAKLVWGPGFTKANRYLAKRKVFGRIYGQGVDGMARTDGAGVAVAKQVIEAMDAMTPGLTGWSSDIRGAVEAGRTQYPTYAGRVVHMPKGAPHAGPNYAIQGTARELLVDALMRWEQTPWGGCTLMPVHDEILAMVPEDQAHEATEALKACMATEIFGVPIVAEADEPSFEWKDSA